MDAIDKERLEVLAGVRGPKTRSRAAVRRQDLAALVSLPKATAVAVTGTVTDTAYNALLADYQALRAAIDVIAAQVKS
ncbi:MAG TPA: hypothetical protein PLX43_02320 [Nitrobacter sp.]|nr:hypothetical protein [Nitrobacter sp.]